MRAHRLVFVLVMVFLGVHFGLTLMYCLPAHRLPAGAHQLATSYSYPTFHQAWALFAPEPQLKGKHMEVRYAQSGQWTAWMRPDQIDYDAHKTFKLSHRSKRYHMIQNSAFYLWQVVEQQRLNGLDDEVYFPSTFNYRQACYLAHHWPIETMPIYWPHDSLQLRLVLTEPLAPVAPEVFILPVYRP